MAGTQSNMGMDEDMIHILSEFVIQLDQKNALEEEKALLKSVKRLLWQKLISRVS